MLENRSFDNLFGRYPGARGTSVGVRWGQQVPLVRCPEWLPGDLPHDLAAWRTSYNDGWMDGFVGEYGPFYAYSQFARDDIPNYYAWTKDFVLNDNTFASAAGLSFPRNPRHPIRRKGSRSLAAIRVPHTDPLCCLARRCPHRWAPGRSPCTEGFRRSCCC
jgi:hypothetical protein